MQVSHVGGAFAADGRGSRYLRGMLCRVGTLDEADIGALLVIFSFAE